MLDLLIKNALILDGAGNKARPGCVGVKAGTLRLSVNALTPAKEVIDARGRYLAPGFIDAHSHGDITFPMEFSMEAKLCQGITTHVAGQCGQSVFPCGPGFEKEHREICQFANENPPEDWCSFTSTHAFLDALSATPLALNMATFVGHNALRAAVMGYANREPTPAELNRMCNLLSEAMACGCMGLSTGLIYMPGCFSRYEEVLALARVVKQFNGIYVTHMRDEADRVTEAVEEVLSIGRETGVRLWISHHKVAGHSNWGRSVDTLKLIDEALEEGLDITLDQYPFPASMTELAACFPPERMMVGAHRFIEQLKKPEFRKAVIQEMNTKSEYESTFLNAGSFHRIQFSGSWAIPEAEGMRVDDYAKKVGKDPYDALFDVYAANRGSINGVYYTMNEADVERIFQHPRTVIGTDGITRSAVDKTHPRAFGSFPRAINYFVKERKLMTLEECVNKGTGRTAAAFGFVNKGRIAEGLDADLVLFDYDLLSNCATFDQPDRHCDGILKVIVAGQVVYEDGVMTAARPGRFVPRQ